MKKIVLTATAATMAIATPAFAADTATDSFVVSASIPPTCTMENVNDINIGDLAINTTAGPNALTMNTAVTGSKSATSNLVYLSCNDTNTMALSSTGPLVNSANVPTAEELADGFTNQIHFRVYVNNYGPGTGNARRQFRSTGLQFNNGARAAMHRQISFVGSVDYDDNNGVRPLAGTYSSTVTATVQIAA